MDFKWPCNEPGGTCVRHVWSAPRTMQTVWQIYDRVKDIPNFVTADPSRFSMESMRWLFRPEVRIYLVDDVGCVVLRHNDEFHADVHITFWDKRLRGREQLAREIARRIWVEEHVRELWTAIPRASRSVLAFARRVGFVVDSSPEDGVQYLRLVRPADYTV